MSRRLAITNLTNARKNYKDDDNRNDDCIKNGIWRVLERGVMNFRVKNTTTDITILETAVW